MGVSEREEDRIVAELQRGRDVETNFQRLFSRYYGPVRQFFVHRGFAPEQCDDLTQEVFFRIYRNIATYRGDTGFGTWILGILRNVWRNEMRRRSALKRAAPEVTLDEESSEQSTETGDPLREIVNRDALDRVERTLRELPPQMRRTMTLRLYRGLTYNDIARLLAISPNTVKRHLAEARKRLQSALDSTSVSSPSSSDR